MDSSDNSIVEKRRESTGSWTFSILRNEGSGKKPIETEHSETVPRTKGHRKDNTSIHLSATEHRSEGLPKGKGLFHPWA